MEELKSKDYVKVYGRVEKLADYRIKPLARIIHSDAFEMAIALVIIINAICLAILTIPTISEDARAAALFIDTICLGIFTAELTVRLLSYGKKPQEFFKSGWNIFDFVIIASTPFFAGESTILRILRLFRLIRIFRFLPEVRILSASIVKSMRPLLSMTALIALLLFLYGMVGTYLFGAQLPVAWGSIGASVMSLVILLTLENFPIYLEESLAVTPLAIPFLLSYVFIIVFTVLNLLIGIVLNAMDEAREEAKQAEKEPGGMQLIAENVDQIAEDGVVTADEIKALKLEITRLRRLLKQEK